MTKVFYTIIAFAFCGTGIPIPVQERIIGGEVAQDGAFPYQVSIRAAGNTLLCGGSVITTSTIITAAARVATRTTANTFGWVGTNNLLSGGTRHAFREMKVHPSYSNTTFANDVALCFTENQIFTNPRVQPIPIDNTYIDGNVIVTLSGWGRLMEGVQAVPNNLQMINLRTISDSECRARMSGIGNIYSTSLCTYTQVGQGLCQGDSGNPLVTEGKLVGIASWGSPCARGFPDVYARISSYFSWIENNIE